MQTSIAPVSISGELPQMFAAITEAGFTGVEIFGHGFLVHVAASGRGWATGPGTEA